jgi:hypothetical protein
MTNDDDARWLFIASLSCDDDAGCARKNSLTKKMFAEILGKILKLKKTLKIRREKVPPNATTKKA